MPRLPVYVRELPDGSLSASLIDYPDLSAHGANLEAALGALEERSRDRVARLSPAARYTLSLKRDIELRSLVVPVRRQESGEEGELQIA
jgi:hypothetical protein